MLKAIIQPSALLPHTIAIAEKASHMLRQEFFRAGGPRKSIDRKIEVFLRQRLMDLYACEWHGEETTHPPISDEDTWVVDPLDGTSDFLRGLRGPALSIALVRNRIPVLGIIASPVAPNNAGDLMSWAEGTELLRNGSPLNHRTCDRKPLLGLNADAGNYAKHNAAVLPEFRIAAIPSPAYRLALVAASELDGAISLTNGLAAWDTAGGDALLRGAGLSLADLSGRPISYRNNGFAGCIAGTRRLIDTLAARHLYGPKDRDDRRALDRSRPAGDNGRLDRARGCLIGQLVGDALGSAVEFRSASDIAKEYPDGVRELKDGGTWNLSAGQPTDDSEMALALARTLVSNGKYDQKAVGQSYVRWLRSGPFDIGMTTSAGLTRVANGQPADSDSQANGALMRICPVGVFCAGNPMLAAKIASQDAGLTHPSEICRSANAAFAAAIATGVDGGSVYEITASAHNALPGSAAGDVLKARLKLAATNMPTDFDRNMGWVLTAFQNAFFWLQHGTSFEEALVATVSKGGDTDTNAAICGALLGAASGVSAIPERWKQTVLTCRAAPGTRKPRPPEYWPDDALDLAEALLTRRSVGQK